MSGSETGHGQPGGEPSSVAARRRKAGSSGRMASPSGRPGSSAGSSSNRAREPGCTGGALYHGKLRDGRFEIRGLAPGAEVPVYFLEPERKLGAVVNLSVKSVAGGPITVRLEPCGSARAWLVDPDGKPVAKPVRGLSIKMSTPGPAQQRLPERQGGQPALRRRGRSERRRPVQLRDGARPRCPQPDRTPRPDPGGDISLHRFHHVRPRPDRPGDPQGIHRQAGPEAQPGRHPNRQASKLVPVHLEQARSARLPRIKSILHTDSSEGSWSPPGSDRFGSLVLSLVGDSSVGSTINETLRIGAFSYAEGQI